MKAEDEDATTMRTEDEDRDQDENTDEDDNKECELSAPLHPPRDEDIPRRPILQRVPLYLRAKLALQDPYCPARSLLKAREEEGVSAYSSGSSSSAASPPLSKCVETSRGTGCTGVWIHA